MAAYDTTYLYSCYVRPVLAFEADLPSFAVIGKNFARVSEAGDEILWSREEDDGTPWRELVDLQTAGESAPTSYRVECGETESVTDGQKRLFDWLLANQARVVEEIKPAVVGLFEETLKWRAGQFPGDRVLFPADATNEEKLDRFVIKHFDLDPKGEGLLIELDSLDGWYNEHGCSILLRNGRLVKWGCWDEINDDA
jgi:hypothetical protein